MNLRPYQISANDAVRRELQSVRSTLVVQPTGTGKTVQFATLAHEWDGRVLVLAHTRELIQQSADKIKRISGDQPDIEMGDMRADVWDRAKIVVASKDSLHEKRLAKFSRNSFDLVIVDEAHRSARKNKTYNRVLDYFNDAKVVGYTATADRKDRNSIIGTVYETVAYEYPIWSADGRNAIDDGYLVPIRQQYIHVTGLDFAKLKTVAGDFTDEELARVLSEEQMLHRMVAPTIELAGDRPTIVFCATIAHAEAMAAVIPRYGRSAVAVSGKTERHDRARSIENFRQGNIQYLCGCDIFVEGFDAPNAACVAICRPTKSRPRYTQMVGRVLRVLPGVIDGIESAEDRRQAITTSAKPEALVLDYCGCSNDLKLTVSIADILAQALPDEVATRAKQITERDGCESREAVKKAQEELEDEKLERLCSAVASAEERRKQITAEAQYRTREIDPFSADSSSWQRDKQRHVKPATPKQVNLLIAFGVSREEASAWSLKQAGAVISSYYQRGDKPDWSRLRRRRVTA